MNLSKIPLWLVALVVGALGLLWYRSRQALMQREADAEQARETNRLMNWRLPWEETVTNELAALRNIADALKTGTGTRP